MTLRFLSKFVFKPHSSSYFIVRKAHDEKSVIVFDTFAQAKDKSKQTYIEMVKMFEQNEPRRRNHCEFIMTALKYMKEFNVHKDLEVYKAILEVLPKGRFVPKNIFQAEFMHFPKQQQTALSLLDQMEDNGVMPDTEMEDILVNTFGRRGYPVRKFWRMMYWMPKFKNLTPWPLPEHLPNEAMELAKLAIKRIASIDLSMNITVFKTEDVEECIDRTWIVSAQCPIQQKLIIKEAEERREEMRMYQIEKQKLENESDKSGNNDVPFKPPRDPLKVHGAYKVYLKDQFVQYFILSGPAVDRKPVYKDIDDVSRLDISTPFGTPSVPALQSDVHEQDDGTIYAICATGTSSRDSLLSWIRLLEKNGNPGLSELPIVFTLLAPSTDVSVIEDPVTGE